MRVSYRPQLNIVTKGLFNTLIDTAIFSVAFLAHTAGGKNPWQSIPDAIHTTKIIHKKNFKRAIYNARHKGYLQRKKDYYSITELGKKRLQQILPQYQEKRPWDGKLYLITYDIPEERKKKRDLLRKKIQNLGCGMLQKSVWLTPYNPTGVLLSFIKESKLAGLVLISDLKEGGFIGGKQAPEAVNRVYNLDELSDQYRKICQAHYDKNIGKEDFILQFLSVLKKDPQLPFELLPDNWWGDEGYRIYKKLAKKINRN
jgi:DNA-binding transcriptional regulator PaaX